MPVLAHPLARMASQKILSAEIDIESCNSPPTRVLRNQCLIVLRLKLPVRVVSISVIVLYLYESEDCSILYVSELSSTNNMRSHVRLPLLALVGDAHC